MDPMAQLSGLVNLINASQAPGMQQAQFNQEMGFKQMMGDRGHRMDQAQLDQRDFAEQNQQYNADRTFGVQEEQNRISDQYNQGRLQDRDQAMQMAAADRRNQTMMDLLQLFMHAGSDPNGSGMLNMDIGNQLGQSMLNPQGRQGFPSLFNVAGTTVKAPGVNDNRELNDEAINAAKLKYQGR